MIFNLLLLLCLYFTEGSYSQILEDIGQKEQLQFVETADIIRSCGFMVETYYISPEPNYNLSLVRIINPELSGDHPDANKPIGLVNQNNGLFTKTRRDFEPVLFIHGIFESAKSFIINSQGVKPKNYAHINIRRLKESGLRYLLRDDAASNSLPFLLSNFGFDVWLLSRRSTLESQKHSSLKPNKSFNLIEAIQSSISRLIQSISNEFNPLKSIDENTTSFGSAGSGSNANSALSNDDYVENLRKQFNTNDTNRLDNIIKQAIYGNHRSLAQSQSSTLDSYWNFSLDEQAHRDIPTVIDSILKKTNRNKLNLVGHSLGAALPLMSLCEKPEYSKKISRAVLFAPALNLGDSYNMNPLVQFIASFEPLLMAYQGPISPSFVLPLMQSLMAGPCQLGLIREPFCLSIVDSLFGFSSRQLNKLSGSGNEVYFKMMDISGSLELVQLIQSMKRGKMHHFDHRNEHKNLLAYGRIIRSASDDIPSYNLSQIVGKTRFSIWSGNKDPLVTQYDTQLLIDQLIKQVEVEKNFIDWPGIHFNHVAFILHKNVSTLVNIPTLITLSSR